MKIAIASETKDKDSDISLKGGRASFYLIFQDEKLIEIWKNPFSVGGGGAGWSVAYALANKNVEKVIAGKIGGNMLTALEQKGILFEEKNGKIFDIFE